MRQETNFVQKRAESDSDRRAEERRECLLAGELKTAKGASSCTINNVSPSGVGLTVASDAPLHIGEKVSISTREFGGVSGEVSWVAHPRYGVAVSEAGRSAPSLRLFFDALTVDGVLSERMRFLRLDNETLQRIREIKPIVERELPKALDQFYDRVRETPSLRTFFLNDVHMTRAKDAQLGHWAAIVSGEFDARYYANVRKIGKAHSRIGLEPRWYIDGYAHIMAALIKEIIIERWPQKLISRGSKKEGENLGNAIAALVKAILLDMDLSISTYIEESEEARLRGEAEVIDHERSLVADSIGLGLSRLAHMIKGGSFNGLSREAAGMNRYFDPEGSAWREVQAGASSPAPLSRPVATTAPASSPVSSAPGWAASIATLSFIVASGMALAKDGLSLDSFR